MRCLRTLTHAVALAILLTAGLARAGSVDEGRKHLEAKRFAQAAEAFRAALAASAGNRDALLGLAQAVTQGRLSDGYEEAAGLLRETLRRTADDREARLVLGNLYLSWSGEDPRWLADAEEQFRRLLKADSGDEDAAVGLARRYYEAADVRRGLEVLDALLGVKPASAAALFWKGELLYDEAQTAFKNGDGRLSDDARAGFEKALGAYEASTKADPKRFDAWIKTGYAAQYLAGTDAAKRETAVAAYEKALDLDGESDLPMRGLSALFGSDAVKWGEVVAGLVKNHPKAPIVLFWSAYQLMGQKKADEAEKAARAFVAASKHPAMGHFLVAQILAERKDEAGALRAYEASLKADPFHPKWFDAVRALEAPLSARATEAMSGVSQAKAVIQAYQALFALAPQDIWCRNNLAFVLREAYTQGQAKDRSILDASIRIYEEASALVPAWREEYERSIPYRDRHQYAQVLNDTGLMYQYYPPVKDAAKAESYYRRAMEWTQHGYWDAYGNLMKLLREQERWQDAYDFASTCAEGLKNENGEADATSRATAAGDAAKLEEKLPKGE